MGLGAYEAVDENQMHRGKTGQKKKNKKEKGKEVAFPKQFFRGGENGWGKKGEA